MQEALGCKLGDNSRDGGFGDRSFAKPAGLIFNDTPRSIDRTSGRHSDALISVHMMRQMQRNVLGTTFSLAIIALAALVAHRFFLALLWAAILCIATWPLYEHLSKRIRNTRTFTALLLTLSIALAFVVPTVLTAIQAGKQAPAVAHFIAQGNNVGIAAPAGLQRIPLVGGYLYDWWLATLAQPHGLSHLLSGQALGRFVSANEILKFLGTQLFHRLLDFGFAMLCLFFFYWNGESLEQQINALGIRGLGVERWTHYSRRIPVAIRATVNGLVLVGLGEGVLIGVGYSFSGISSPALWAALTGVLAILPFGATVAFLSAAAMLFGEGNSSAAIGIAAWGSVVVFIADHFIRPVIIGNATRLPFLAVLFGILGGLETFGLVGLFIGPVLMVLFITLWHEPELVPDGATEPSLPDSPKRHMR